MKKTRRLGGPTLEWIELSGIQTIRDPVRIDLAPVTLLFGPNSAGKSSIADALDLLHMFWASVEPYRPWPFESSLRPIILGPHVRRESGGRAPAPLCLSARMHVPGMMGPTSDWWWYRYSAEATLRVDSDLTGLQLDLSLYDMGLFKLVDGVRFALNTRHPILQEDPSTGASALPKSINRLNARMEDGWLTKEADFRLSGHGGLHVEGMWTDPYIEYHLAEAADPDEDMSWAGPYRAAVVDIAQCINQFLAPLARDFLSAVNFGRVLDSRTVPSTAELTYEMHVSDSRKTAVNGGAPEFRGLARDTLRHTWTRDFPQFAPSVKDGNLDRDPGDVYRRVNDVLRDHLMTQTGYQVSATYEVVLSKSALVQLLDPQNTAIPIGTRAVVTLGLTDTQGRHLAFEHVGSGIGYVLPAVVQLCESGCGLVAQPELHLHPALQAALGDVVLEARSLKDVVVIETHSEHLLLRILKRMRGSEAGRLPVESSLHTAVDDVAVYFFDPKADGATEVRRLRLAPDGEFLDRWPRGFFTERDGELFDE